MNDELLVRQILSGNIEAFRLLVLRYQRPMFRFLGLLGFTPTAAEDIAQESFLRAYRSLRNFDPARAQFSTWLFTIAKRLATNERQSLRWRVESPTNSFSEPVFEAKSPADVVQTAERLRRVHVALQALEEPMRSTFIFAQIEELGLEEIAALQDCAIGTVKSRIHRARELLRLAVTDEES